MLGPDPDRWKAPADEFDYSTPEAQAALEGMSELVLEIRQEIARQVRLPAGPSGGYERKVRRYERTLGLAVIPVLLRRAAIRMYQRIRQRRQGIR
jgi:hypothetical protein